MVVLQCFLILFSKSLWVSALPATGVGNVTMENGRTKSGPYPPSSSYLVESSHKPQGSLLDPSQLMNSSVNCSAFTIGSHKKFSSPQYPDLYPNDIDCIKIIEAKDGEVVVVEFYDFFHVEASPAVDPSIDCPYDYLEIRFGKFGYSPFGYKICGSHPPTSVKSSGKYLWLRFHSDETVNYKGFRATIDFKPDTSTKEPFQSCISEVFQAEGDIISKRNISLDYLEFAQSKENSIDCTWVIQAPPDHKIFLRMNNFSLEQPNNCEHNVVYVYESYAKLAGKKTSTPALKLCGSIPKWTIPSEDNVMAVRLVTKVGSKALLGERKKLSQFAANYTIFRPKGNNGSCEPGVEFDCDDGNCIPIALQCNDKINCQVKKDEENCPNLSKEGIKADIFIIAFLGALLVVGMCTGMFLNIFRKLKQDREELLNLRAQQRKSRESGLASEVQSQKSANPSESIQNPQPGWTLQSPTIGEQSSTESRETVIHKPIIPALPGTSDSTKKPYGEPTTNPVEYVDSDPPSTNNPGYGPSYGWAPPAVPLGQKRFPGRRASDIPSVPLNHLQVAVYQNPPPSREPEPILEAKSTQCPPALTLVPMQFVRDCACQTRESYLLSRRHGKEVSLRAPLARGEAIEYFQGTAIRRHSRQQTPTSFFPPSSASSEIGNSLERLDEAFE